jgi:hypothetical protein
MNHGLTKNYPVTIEQEVVVQANRWYAGLAISDESYVDIEAQGVMAELPMYAFHEGNAVNGTFEDFESEAVGIEPAVIGTWQIMLNGAPADYETIQAIVDAA